MGSPSLKAILFENRTTSSAAVPFSNNYANAWHNRSAMPSPPSEAIAGNARPYWTPADLRGCPFGVLVCAICPGEPPGAALAHLSRAELEFADGLSPPGRRYEWLGGRLCLAHALTQLAPAPRPPMLPTRRGAPTVPAGIAGSISHKGPLAMALAAQTPGGLGVDVEYVADGDITLENKVLTSAERRTDSDLMPAQRVAVHFAIKEAIYKALGADGQTTLEFDEIELDLPIRTTGNWTCGRAWITSRGGTCIQTAVIFDGEWIVAVAFRTS